MECGEGAGNTKTVTNSQAWEWTPITTAHKRLGQGITSSRPVWAIWQAPVSKKSCPESGLYHFTLSTTGVMTTQTVTHEKREVKEFSHLSTALTGTAATMRVCGDTGSLGQNVPRESPQLQGYTSFIHYFWPAVDGMWNGPHRLPFEHLVWEGCGDFLEETSHKGWALRFYGLKELSTHSASRMWT